MSRTALVLWMRYMIPFATLSVAVWWLLTDLLGVVGNVSLRSRTYIHRAPSCSFTPSYRGIRMRLSHLVAIGLVATACAPKGDAPAAPTMLSAVQIDSVKAVDVEFANAMNAKDTAAVFAVYAADAKMMPTESPTLDMTAARGVVSGLMAGGASDFVLTATDAYGVGDLAYMVGTASFKMAGATEQLKYTEVLRRGTDGKWRYVVDMFSPIGPPPAAVKK
ncbi:MAG: DUF4440 domain-containing protein [Gemmatimonadaceae bacterium]